MTEINWGYNCLTSGIHHGRPEEIWNLPLVHAVQIYGNVLLKEIVVARIYNDAMQFVKHTNTDHAITTPEWADRVKALAEEQFDCVLKDKIDEISDFYKSSGWVRDIRDVADRVSSDTLNSNYKPLHGHDSINMLCRILGQRAAIEASR